VAKRGLVIHFLLNSPNAFIDDFSTPEQLKIFFILVKIKKQNISLLRHTKSKESWEDNLDGEHEEYRANKHLNTLVESVFSILYLSVDSSNGIEADETTYSMKKVLDVHHYHHDKLTHADKTLRGHSVIDLATTG
jgi:hypothetical protein